MIKNKKIFITGASGGIGDAVCNKFKNDNNLILTSSSDENLEKLKIKFGNNHFFYKVGLHFQIHFPYHTF